MEKLISQFHEGFYIPVIQKLALWLTYVVILGTQICGKYFLKALYFRGKYKNTKYCCDYADNLFESFSN